MNSHDKQKRKIKSVDKAINNNDLMLTDEELNSFEWVKSLPPDQKRELSLLVFELSIALYNLYSPEDD